MSLLALAVAASGGVTGLVSGHVLGWVWRVWWKAPRTVLKNVRREDMSPEDQARLAEIESNYSNATGRAMSDL